MNARSAARARVEAERMLARDALGARRRRRPAAAEERAASTRWWPKLQASARHRRSTRSKWRSKALAGGTEAFAEARMNGGIRRALVGPAIEDV